jgi:hypothetical protein
MQRVATTRFYEIDQVDPTTRADLRQIFFSSRLVILAWEFNPLNIGPGADTSKLGDAIYNP